MEIDFRDWAQMEYDIHFGHMDEPNTEELKENSNWAEKAVRGNSFNVYLVILKNYMT